MRQSVLFPLILLVCGLAVRFVYFSQFQTSPFFDYVPPAWDQTVYHEGGQAFAFGDWLAVAPDQYNKFAPLYQYFVGLLYLIFGVDLSVVWIAHALLGVASSLLIYRIGLRYFSPGVSCLAALLFSCYGGALLYEGTLYRETFMTFLELAALLALLYFVDKPSWSRAIFSAVLLSLFMQSRTNNLLAAVLALAFLWKPLFARGGAGRPWLAGYLAVFVLVSAPLLFWVKTVHGKWGFYDQDGPETLLFANVTDYSGREFKFTPQYLETIQTVPLETGAVVEFIVKNALEHPWEYLKLYLRKTFHFFNGFEVPNTVNYYLTQEFVPLLQWSVPFGFLSALGLLGFVLTRWEQRRWNLLHVFLVANFLMFLPFFVTARFRLLMVPFLCLFSAYALQRLIDYGRERRFAALATTFASASLLLWSSQSRPLPEGPIRILDLTNTGSFYLSNADPEDDARGVEFYKRGWELSRSLPPEHQNPGLTRTVFWDYYDKRARRLQAEGRHEAAALNYRRALYFDAGKVETRARLAQVLFDQRLARPAFIQALQAVEMDHQKPEAHLLLAILYNHTLNMPVWSAYHMQAALGLNPGDKELKEQLESFLDRLVLIGVLSAEARGAGIEGLRKILLKRFQALKPFPRDLKLPKELETLSEDLLERYKIELLQRRLLEPGREAGEILYQLGVLSSGEADNLQYAYWLRAWDAGAQFEALQSVLKELEGRWRNAVIPEEFLAPPFVPVSG
ncbi:MAG: glycosyltransferase family 39 protein [Candidatus Nitrohelix vancouverensis]|uniref:Glycosyltransferase family 39 protein n=1 Tax=Candidatus Nitrohelix vancouverensis TaxID=2705534 RepID=A0A7T0G2N3_9BACT|nr:MAG: glycosyltransferase family 39 protein [Candidatus Nitrohelix vancouverensis]